MWAPFKYRSTWYNKKSIVQHKSQSGSRIFYRLEYLQLGSYHKNTQANNSEIVTLFPFNDRRQSTSLRTINMYLRVHFLLLISPNSKIFWYLSIIREEENYSTNELINFWLKYLWMKSKFSSETIKERHSLHCIEYCFQENIEYILTTHYSCANLFCNYFEQLAICPIWQFVNMVNNLAFVLLLFWHS